MLTKAFDFMNGVSEYFKKRKRVKARLELSDRLLSFILKRPERGEVFSDTAEGLGITVWSRGGSYSVVVKEDENEHVFTYHSHPDAVAGVSNLDGIILDDTIVAVKFYTEGIELEIAYNSVNGHGK